MAWVDNRFPFVGRLFGDNFFVQFGPEILRVENLTTGRHTEIKRPTRRGFGHPRCVIGSFEAAKETLHLAFARVRRSLLGGLVQAGTRTVLVQIRRELDGGLTDVEARGLLDLHYECSGAHKVRLYERQHRLSEEDVRRLLKASPTTEPGLW